MYFLVHRHNIETLILYLSFFVIFYVNCICYIFKDYFFPLYNQSLLLLVKTHKKAVILYESNVILDWKKWSFWHQKIPHKILKHQNMFLFFLALLSNIRDHINIFARKCDILHSQYQMFQKSPFVFLNDCSCLMNITSKFFITYII